MSNRPSILYYYDSKPITQNDVKNALVDVGINKGDIIMVHSDIGTFGKLGTFDRNFLLKSLIDVLKEVVGKNGTIVMPTFTYSFYENKAYDVENSKSTVGILTEYFRKMQGVIRSKHPTHSVAIWGKNKELAEIGNDTFDKFSIFGSLHKFNAKQVFLGVPFSKSCTFVHYIEQIHGVWYRYMRKFKCNVFENTKIKVEEISLYYRYFFFLNSFKKLEHHLLKKGLLKQIMIGHNSISMIETKLLFDECYKLLDKDAYYLLNNDNITRKLINHALYPFLMFFPWPMRKFNDLMSGIFRWIKFNIKNPMD